MPTLINQFSVKIGSLEARTTEGGKAEIILWGKIGDDERLCYTVAYWQSNANGTEWHLCFVQSRPFEVDRNHFWILAEIGQKILEFQR